MDEKTPDYFFDSLGFTALAVGQDHHTAITYDAYGTTKPSSSVDTRSSFEFGQEFTDQTSGLENRYAYCEGDSINIFDPLGQSWEAIAGVDAIVVIAVVGAIATAGEAAGNVVGGVVTAEIQGSSYTGTNALVDALTGAVGGAAGKLMEPTAKAWAAGAKYGGKPLSPLAQEALASRIIDAVNHRTQFIVRPVLLGEPAQPADGRRIYG